MSIRDVSLLLLVFLMILMINGRGPVDINISIDMSSLMMLKEYGSSSLDIESFVVVDVLVSDDKVWNEYRVVS